MLLRNSFLLHHIASEVSRAFAFTFRPPGRELLRCTFALNKCNANHYELKAGRLWTLQAAVFTGTTGGHGDKGTHRARTRRPVPGRARGAAPGPAAAGERLRSAGTGGRGGGAAPAAESSPGPAGLQLRVRPGQADAHSRHRTAPHGTSRHLTSAHAAGPRAAPLRCPGPPRPPPHRLPPTGARSGRAGHHAVCGRSPSAVPPPPTAAAAAPGRAGRPVEAKRSPAGPAAKP